MLPKIYGSLFDQLKGGIRGDFFDILDNLNFLVLIHHIICLNHLWFLQKMVVEIRINNYDNQMYNHLNY